MEPLVLRGELSNYRSWREQAFDLYGVEAQHQPPREFDLTLTMVRAGAASLSTAENRGGNYSIERSARHIASDASPAQWMVGICLAGNELSSIGHGSETCTAAGGLRLMHSKTPLKGTTPTGARVGMLFLPEAMCGAATRWAPVSLAARDGLARVLSATLASVFEELPRLSPSELEPIVPSLIPLIDAVAAPSRDSAERARPSVRAAQRRRILRFIDTNLAHPRLRASWIAAALGISRRYLHALFAEGPSVGETILSLRLERCREAIGDPAQSHRALTEIAFLWGFNDASHFARTFRRRFGMTPSDARSRRS